MLRPSMDRVIWTISATTMSSDDGTSKVPVRRLRARAQNIHALRS